MSIFSVDEFEGCKRYIKMEGCGASFIYREGCKCNA